MSEAEPKIDVTVWIRKAGRVVHLGHRDFARTVDRGLRRSGLPFHLTEGFHPHPRMVLPEPLPLGVGSEGEPFVLRFAAEVSDGQVATELGSQLHEDVGLVAARRGDHRDPRDLPIRLRLQAGDVELLSRAFEELRAESLGLRELRRSGSDPFEVELIPPSSVRVSVGKFLRALRERAGEACVIRSVCRLSACTDLGRH